MKNQYYLLGILACFFSNALFANTLTINISTCDELQAMQNNLSADYILINDIDCSETREWNNGAGFKPVGNDEQYFSGTLRSAQDRGPYIIYNLFINRPYETHIGLFGYSHNQEIKVVNKHISRIGLIDPIIIGGQYVGAITGLSQYTNIDESFVEGGRIEGSSTVGGLSGFHLHHTINNSHADTTIVAESIGGGLVGESRSRIIESYSMGEVHFKDSLGNHLGGLVGINRNIIENSYSATDLTGNDYVGGLVGSNHGDIETSYAKGNIVANSKLGGLAGESSERISDSYATGKISYRNEGYSNRFIGGLVGRIDSYSNASQNAIIERCYATGNVSGTEYVGGLVGQIYDGIVSESYALGTVEGDLYVGGLVGSNDAHWFNSFIRQSYATGLVIGPNNENYYVGGLVGINDTKAFVLESFWDIDSSMQNTSDGGLGKTTTEMMQQATFYNWNFATVWQIDENVSYPYFHFQ